MIKSLWALIELYSDHFTISASFCFDKFIRLSSKRPAIVIFDCTSTDFLEEFLLLKLVESSTLITIVKELGGDNPSFFYKLTR